jgi:hypothetical protein
MARSHLSEGLPRLECRHEAAFLFGGPRASDLVWKLGASLGASRNLLQRCDAREQRPQHVSLLEDCRSGKFLTGHWVDTLDERLKYLSCTLFLHV